MHGKYFVIRALYQTCKGIVRNFPMWLSTPISNPKIWGSAEQKAYGDPHTRPFFLPSPSKNGKKSLGTRLQYIYIIQSRYAQRFIVP